MSDWKLLALALAFIGWMATDKRVSRRRLRLAGLLVIAIGGSAKVLPMIAAGVTSVPGRTASAVDADAAMERLGVAWGPIFGGSGVPARATTVVDDFQQYCDTLSLPRPSVTGITDTIYVSSDASGADDGQTSGAPLTLAQMRDTVAAGDLVYMRGDFTGSDSYILLSNAATSSNWIHITQWPGQTGAILHGQSGGSEFQAFSSNGPYTVVEGITLYNNNNSNYIIIADTAVHLVDNTIKKTGVKVGNNTAGAGCVDCWVDNNTIDSVGTAADNSNDGVILGNGSMGQTSTGNYIVRNTIGYSGHAGMTLGWVISGAGIIGDNNVVALNTVTNPWAGGINMNGNAQDVTVECNDISDSGTADIGSPGSQNGIQVQGRDNVVRFNRVWNTDSAPISVQHDDFLSPPNDTTARNQIYHNSVYTDAAGIPALELTAAVSTKNADDALINNTFENNVGLVAGYEFSSVFYAVYIDSNNMAADWTSMGGNLFRNNGIAVTGGTGGAVIFVENSGTSTYSTFANFVSTYTGNDDNLLETTDPFVDVDSDDFTLSLSTWAIDAGNTNPGFSFLGSAPDLGAWERN